MIVSEWFNPNEKNKKKKIACPIEKATIERQ